MEFLNDLEVCEMAKTLTSKQAASGILANFLPLVNEIKIDSTKLASVREDLISKSVLPAGHSDWIPLVSTANGNCLFNAVSIAISGGEALAATLRLLTVSELLGLCKFYAQHPQLVSMAQVSGYSAPALINILLNNEKAEKLCGKTGSVSRAMEALAKETAKLYVYSSQFHIMSLASVIQKPIKVVYQDIPTTIRIKKALHCVLHPREISDGQSDLICIMWTKTNISSLHGWEPNNFVPLLSKTKRSNLRLSFADAVKTTTTESSKLTNNVSTSATTTKCHRKYYTESKVQTKPNIGRKNSSAQASTTPP